jgi:hypothetical protein
MIGAILTVSVFVAMLIAAICFEVKSIRRQRYFNDVISGVNERVTQIRRRRGSGPVPTVEMTTMERDE